MKAESNKTTINVRHADSGRLRHGFVRIKTGIYRTLQDYHSDYPRCYPVGMKEEEQHFLVDSLAGAGSYLEFGTGGSTFLALLHSSAQVAAVDSDEQWINSLRKWKLIRCAEDEGRLMFRLTDLGKTGMWGVPTGTERKDHWPDYSSGIFNQLETSPDVVLVDGRFRVACVAQAILHGNLNTRILVHDYYDEKRVDYHVIEQFLDLKRSAGNLVLFKIKQDIDTEKILELYEENKFNCQ